MKTFRHILFPVDFSERCEAARPVVTAWAQHFHAKVTLLHTVQIPISSYGGADGYPIILDVPGIEEAAKARLDRSGIPGAEGIVKMGDPAYEIVKFAQENDVDLIMMPTHGYGTFRSLLLGSTASKVLHDAHCPVWTGAHIEQMPAQHRTEVQSILCAVELGDEAAPLIRSAKELADAWQAKLRLVHAVPSDEFRPEKYLEGALKAALIKTGQEQLAALQKEAGTDLEVHIHGGLVSEVVRDAAATYEADLVITGAGKVHRTFAKLRSSAFAIIRECPCPVLSA